MSDSVEDLIAYADKVMGARQSKTESMNGSPRIVEDGTEKPAGQKKQRRFANFRVHGGFDGEREATVTIDRKLGLFLVRPRRRRRVYSVPLSWLAAFVLEKVVKAEVAAKRKARRR